MEIPTVSDDPPELLERAGLHSSVVEEKFHDLSHLLRSLKLFVVLKFTSKPASFISTQLYRRFPPFTT